MENKIKIKKDKTYKIITKSKYFKEKYGNESPVIHLLERDFEVFGDKWRNRQYVPAVLAFMLRQVADNVFNLSEPAYYGKIKTGESFELGELVFKSELEAIK